MPTTDVATTKNGIQPEAEQDDFTVPVAHKDEQALLAWLRQHKTPLEMVDTRQGRGGKEFFYVRHQYITQTLNDVCGHDWDFEILRERMDKDQITVLGKLTIRIGDNRIVKSQYGSSDVKRKKGGKPLSIGDDFKSAASDALKKCASLVGLGLDLSIPVQPKTLQKLHIVGNEAYEKSEKYTWDEKRPWIIRVFTGGDKTSSKDLLEVEARILTSMLEGGKAPIVKKARQLLHG